jgi:tetratricopeptide (TPR) repeat protein
MIYLTTKQTAVWKDSLTLWNYVIEMEPGKTYFSYNNRGIAYSDIGQYDRALEDYNKVISMNPDYSSVYNNRGVVYSRQGLYDMAIEDFSRSIVLTPNFSDAYNNRGVAFDKAGRFDKAIEDFQKAIVLNPGLKGRISTGGLPISVQECRTGLLKILILLSPSTRVLRMPTITAGSVFIKKATLTGLSKNIQRLLPSILLFRSPIIIAGSVTTEKGF